MRTRNRTRQGAEFMLGVEEPEPPDYFLGLVLQRIQQTPLVGNANGWNRPARVIVFRYTGKIEKVIDLQGVGSELSQGFAFKACPDRGTVFCAQKAVYNGTYYDTVKRVYRLYKWDRRGALEWSREQTATGSIDGQLCYVWGHLQGSTQRLGNIAVDAEGNIYVAWYNFTGAFPKKLNIDKWSSQGVLLYSAGVADAPFSSAGVLEVGYGGRVYCWAEQSGVFLIDPVSGGLTFLVALPTNAAASGETRYSIEGWQSVAADKSAAQDALFNTHEVDLYLTGDMLGREVWLAVPNGVPARRWIDVDLYRPSSLLKIERGGKVWAVFGPTWTTGWWAGSGTPHSPDGAWPEYLHILKYRKLGAGNWSGSKELDMTEGIPDIFARRHPKAKLTP